jgi:formate/nitrite transporter
MKEMKDAGEKEMMLSGVVADWSFIRSAAFVSRSVLAGMLIGLGCVAYVLALPDNKVLGSFLFSLGLISVILQQLNLFTGKIGYLRFGMADICRLIWMLIWNFAGICMLGALFCYTRLDMSQAASLMAVKLSDSLLSLFILGIGCGVMMYLAVDNFKRHRHPLYVVLPIMFFILCGFEHCIADMGYFAIAVCSGFDTWTVADIAVRITVIVAGNAVGSILVNKFSLGFRGCQV